MLLLKLFLLILLAASFFFRTHLRGAMRFLPAVALLATLIAFLAPGPLSRSEQERVNQLSYLHASATVMAQEMARHIPEGGDVLLILRAEAFGQEKAITRLIREGLEAGFGGSGLRLAGIEPNERSVSDPVLLRILIESHVSSAAYRKLLAHYPDLVAVVSTLNIEPPHAANSEGQRPALYMLGVADSPATSQLIEDGIVQAGVFYRSTADENLTPDKRASPEELFQSLYVLVSKDNFQDSIKHVVLP